LKPEYNEQRGGDELTIYKEEVIFAASMTTGSAVLGCCTEEHFIVNLESIPGATGHQRVSVVLGNEEMLAHVIGVLHESGKSAYGPGFIARLDQHLERLRRLPAEETTETT
jgi:hypothetical protein